MGDILRYLPYEDWVRLLFDHEVRDPAWYFDPDAPEWTAPARLSVKYITWLFNDPVPVLEPYSDAQLDQGFWYLVPSSGSKHTRALHSRRVPLSERILCMRSFTSLFRQIFAVRCSPDPSNEDGEDNPLNSSCYMWWDLLREEFDLMGSVPCKRRHRKIDRVALEVMAEILRFDSIACQESALHGLSDWREAYPKEIKAIVERFQLEGPYFHPKLLPYVKYASTGIPVL